VKRYSLGMRQRLGVARSLLADPELLILDEPTNGLDPAAIRDFYEILLGLRTQGVTIVLTSHILADLQQRADRFAVMAAGRMQAVGSVAALRAQLGLPVTLALRLEAGARLTAIRRLQAEPGLALEIQEGVTEQDLTVRCVPQAKMAVLAALQPLGRWLDLHIHEPSLEDLFLGLGRQA
jgi:Cu-processing system ATP-binding protein